VAPGSSDSGAASRLIGSLGSSAETPAQTLEEATAIGLLPQRIAAWIAGSVGSVGLLLSALGLYGLAAFSVLQRTRELALRMALGATRESVMSLVLGQSARLALVEGAIGVALALGVSLVLRTLLIGIRPADPLAFGTAVSTLAIVLLAASWFPARRASQLDPMRVFRAEWPSRPTACIRAEVKRYRSCTKLGRGRERRTETGYRRDGKRLRGRADLAGRRAAFARFRNGSTGTAVAHRGDDVGGSRAAGRRERRRPQEVIARRSAKEATARAELSPRGFHF
jgi:hypothetical protein